MLIELILKKVHLCDSAATGGGRGADAIFQAMIIMPLSETDKS